MTAYKPRAPGSLKAAVTALVEANGGQVVAAEFLGLSKSQLFKWTDDSDENAGKSMPAHRVRALESRCGDPVVSRFLAAEAGCLLLRLPAADAETGDWNRDIAGLLSGAADCAAVLAADMADNGVIDAPGIAIDRIDDVLAQFGAARRRLVALRDFEGT